MDTSEKGVCFAFRVSWRHPDSKHAERPGRQAHLPLQYLKDRHLLEPALRVVVAGAVNLSVGAPLGGLGVVDVAAEEELPFGGRVPLVRPPHVLVHLGGRDESKQPVL